MSHDECEDFANSLLLRSGDRGQTLHNLSLELRREINRLGPGPDIENLKDQDIENLLKLNNQYIVPMLRLFTEDVSFIGGPPN